MSKHPFINKLNDLDARTWLKFQKSWFVHNPPPRRKDVLRHPAKFPETLAQEFIEFFTHRGQIVLDPMAGTGSALVAALRAGRNCYGVELNPYYASIAKQVILEEQENLGPDAKKLVCEIIQGNAERINEICDQHAIPTVDYMITSPPYWNMLKAYGAETQKKRRQNPGLDVAYSDDVNDLGNIEDYEIFLKRLTDIYISLESILRSGAYLTIIVKNIKKGGIIYPLAWDLAHRLEEIYILKDERIWCQDDIRLAPYGLGNAWVSNTFHHYCLQFRKK
jgi:DNA modification methylase